MNIDKMKIDGEDMTNTNIYESDNIASKCMQQGSPGERSTMMEESNTCPVQHSASSVAQSCLTLCDPMNPSMPGLPVHHQLPEFTQTDVHRVSDVIQPSHPLSPLSPPAPNPSQHQSLFQ